MILTLLCTIGFIVIGILTTFKLNSLASLVVNVVAYFAYYCALEIAGLISVGKAVAVFCGFSFVIIMTIISFHRQRQS
ncbi:hypothetical protein [Loigolactobacillus zhaoyuanensis]|uniref:Uncharacterized protein n=1 Tax=Loigolactobacillus zhaoyuanensis TaxID=2486017 RepID=A0ABW8UIP3_9LACO|nr:hypothetical protein [Loigolactobacillus zhaoyuanensis]